MIGTGQRGRIVRSISAPPAVREGEGRVSFSNSTKDAPTGREAAPHSAAQTNKLKSSSVTPPTARSRSVSPSARSVGSHNSIVGHGTAAPHSSEIDAAAVSLLELRRQEKEHERLRARQYAQRKREQQMQTPASGRDISAVQSPPAQQWNTSTTVEKPRSSSAPRRASVTTEPGAAGEATAQRAGSEGASERSSSRAAGDKCWLPPKLSSVEVEAARNTPLPAVSVYQQRGIREWILNTFNIRLLDAECGFSMLGGDAENRNTPETIVPDGGAELLTKHGGRGDPRFEVISQHAPPPLPLQEDRLRNGVLLGQLLLRLEPHAATHARIPRVLHKHPRSMAVCLENVERVLWVFKLRRCPPIPLQYLSQPEEVLKGTVPLVWGLLWEIMQAYPYAATNPVNADRTAVPSLAGGLGGVLPATAKLAAPVESAPQQQRVPIRDGLARMFGHAADVAATRRKSATTRRTSTGPGLKGEEARHNVPSTMRYNYADPHLENPVAAHTLPYSDRQRHHLDQSLLHWLQGCGVMTDIVGSLSQPVTILALESYCRDGTLFCMLAERVLKLALAKDWHRRPGSYSECMSNLKLCLDTLRKCQNMRPRYLYAGAEEDICRGKWDSILGLMEDMHRLADKVHPHAQIVNTVDPQGNIVRDVGGRDVLNYRTVEAPYLGSNPQFTAELEAGDQSPSTKTDDMQRVGAKVRYVCGVSIAVDTHNLLPLLQQRSQAPAETEWNQPGAFAAGVSSATSSRSNLLHDVPYTFGPALDLAPPPPAEVPVPRPVIPGLAAQLQTRQDNHLADSFLNYQPQPAAAPSDLYPSNPVAGQNVVTVLSRQRQDEVESAPTHSAHPPLHPRATHRESRIPTPVKSRSPTHAEAPESPSSVPRPRSTVRTPAAAPLRVNTSIVPDSLEKDRAEGRRLAQALNLTDSETETRGRNLTRSPLTSPGRTVSYSPDGGRRQSPRSGKGRSPSSSKGRSASPLSSSAVKRFHQYNRRGPNTTAVSEFDTDSLDEAGSAGSPDSVRDADIVENTTNNVDLHKVRRLLSWFQEIGLHVEHRNGNFTRHAFSDGVLLCALLQKLERCGPLTGTFPHPRTHSERVQNVRRCLELLATRHKSIPLRVLSCEDDVLNGDMARTVELLLNIRKAYATHRL
jgi:hypothetical protein